MKRQQDRAFMTQAIDQAVECKKQGAEDDLKPHPNVGVVLVRSEDPPVAAFRGMRAPGTHAEYVALESLNEAANLAGSTLYTTLEPCVARRHPKIACADRVASRKISEVVIGMLDPNPVITGKGLLLLRDKGIRVRLFDPDLMEKVEELNRDFQRHFRPLLPFSLEAAENRSLDEWYRIINSIYSRNFTRDITSIFTHFVEIVGGLASVAAGKVTPRVTLEEHIPKALGWWLALCGRVGVRSPADMLWAKFPAVCPYCLQRPHRQATCIQRKAKALEDRQPALDWELLRLTGERNSVSRPHTFADWQRMFAEIYPPGDGEQYGHTISKLTEELGELGEAIRAIRVTPAYFLNEAADLFAWLMHLQTILDTANMTPDDQVGFRLTERFSAAYPDRCGHCQNQICVCPPILGSTLGRIGHERQVAGSELLGPRDILRLFGLSTQPEKESKPSGY